MTPSQFPTAGVYPLQVPFTVNCPVPGRFRWVTTNIARWDPSIEWPTDLDCTFEWNTALKSFDGAYLVGWLHASPLEPVYSFHHIQPEFISKVSKLKSVL